MQRIGLRELRQSASKWVRLAEQGETLEITVHGRPVARMIPAPGQDVVSQLEAAGRLRRAQSDLLAFPPLPAARRKRTLSALLQEARAQDR